jgi:putative FmdB family regulatory protein
MPVYEYMCLECGTITEVVRPIKSRNDVTNCNRCGAATERIMSRFNTVGLAASQKTRETFKTDRAGKARGTAVRMAGGSAKFKNCSFRDFQTGISVAKGLELSIDGSKFENVDKPIEVTDE